VTVANRTLERAQALVAAFEQMAGSHAPDALPLTADALRDAAPRVELIVNATSVGMWPEVEHSPWPEDVEYPAQAFLFDLIYRPRETRLMHRAREAGAQAADGLGMLVHQGAEAFELWTDVPAPVEAMYEACMNALEGE
jgi:shikimate dehydrogenase